jgi:hypothetical protein
MKADLAGESIRDVATPVAPVAGKKRDDRTGAYGCLPRKIHPHRPR